MFVERGLEAALAEMTFSAATTSRQLKRRASIDPAQLGARVAANVGTVAIVFGEEKRGLSDEDLAPCHEVCRIPTEPEQPSMNLAQSAAVLAYALHAAVRPPIAATAPPPATHADLAAAVAEARRALLSAGFLNSQNPELVLAELARTWERAALSPREAELWRNAFRKLADELGRLS
jgi:tRNA/rRNA methyltransferase